VAAWCGLDGFEGRASLRAWMYRIVTNRCLNALRETGRRAFPAPVSPFEPPRTDPASRGDGTAALSGHPLVARRGYPAGPSERATRDFLDSALHQRFGLLATLPLWPGDA